MIHESAENTVRIQSLNTERPFRARSSSQRCRIRRLAENNREVAQVHQGRSLIKQLQRYTIAVFLIAGVAAVLMGHVARQNEGRMPAWRDFLRIYRKQYRQITSGQPNYCDQSLNTQTLFARIREQRILHQENALLRLELALRNDSRFVAIALVGPPGVGKSLVARALLQSFPWRENVHSYAWNTLVRHGSEKTALVQMIADRLSDCGRNLLVIDNLVAKDNHIVKCLNRLFQESTNAEIPKKLIVLYIFSLNTLEELGEYRKQHFQLQNIPSTTTINFKTFGHKELEDCIIRDALIENITLSIDDTKELIHSIDVCRSGCKNVHAKLLIVYGRSNIF